MEYEKLLENVYKGLPEKVFKHERFEMPVVDSLIQGNKTIIRNFDFIADTLRRSPELLAKYLSRELAVPAGMEGKRLVLAGRFQDRVLNERITNFAKSFVLCKECGKPDTKLVDAERGAKNIVCEACGARAPAR